MARAPQARPTAEWVRAEHHWYSRLRGDFLLWGGLYVA
jgi:hypothetical protein